MTRDISRKRHGAYSEPHQEHYVNAKRADRSVASLRSAAISLGSIGQPRPRGCPGKLRRVILFQMRLGEFDHDANSFLRIQYKA